MINKILMDKQNNPTTLYTKENLYVQLSLPPNYYFRFISLVGYTLFQLYTIEYTYH